MDRVTRVRAYSTQQRDRLTAGYRWVRRQPSWVVQVALLTFFLVVGLPILLLVMLAVSASMVVLGSLALVDLTVRKLRGLNASGQGRENVRVIRRD